MREFNKDMFAWVEGKKDGPSSLVLAGVHGNEVAGIRALKRALADIRIEAGEVYLGIGNPRAVEAGIRTVDTNLNRLFRPLDQLTQTELNSYEWERAQTVKEYADKTGALLDIHGTKNPSSQPFLICEANGYEIASYLPYNLVVSGFDTHEPGGTDYYMNQIRGGVGICAETGQNEAHESEVRAAQTLNSFLIARGHKAGFLEARSQRRIAVYSLYRTQTNDYSLAGEKILPEFSEVPAGYIMGTDGGNQIVVERPSIVIFADQVRYTKIGEEAFLLAEDIKPN